MQRSIQARRVAEVELGRYNTEENEAKYKEKKKMAKKMVATGQSRSLRTSV